MFGASSTTTSFFQKEPFLVLGRVLGTLKSVAKYTNVSSLLFLPFQVHTDQICR